MLALILLLDEYIQKLQRNEDKKYKKTKSINPKEVIACREDAKKIRVQSSVYPENYPNEYR